jgi:hypothetical protein
MEKPVEGAMGGGLDNLLMSMETSDKLISV